MDADNTQPAAAPAEERRAQSDLCIFDKPVEQDGLYLFASLECKEMLSGVAYLTLDAKTGVIALALPCGCGSTVNIGSMLLSLAKMQAGKYCTAQHGAAVRVH